MKALVTLMRDLTGTVDASGQRVLQFLYTNLDGPNPIVAYRFTSDWAYQRFEHELVAIGGCLGRGVFKPWSNDTQDQYNFDLHVLQKTEAEAGAACNRRAQLDEVGSKAIAAFLAEEERQRKLAAGWTAAQDAHTGVMLKPESE